MPNAIAGRCSQPDDILGDGTGGGVVDFGRFFTGFLVVMGVGEYFATLDGGGKVERRKEGRMREVRRDSMWANTVE